MLYAVSWAGSTGSRYQAGYTAMAGEKSGWTVCTVTDGRAPSGHALTDRGDKPTVTTRRMLGLTALMNVGVQKKM